MKKNWVRWIALGLVVGMLSVQTPVVYAADALDGSEDVVVKEDQIADELIVEESNQFFDVGFQKGYWRSSGRRWWFQFVTGGYAKNGIYTIGGYNYAFDESGWMVTGWYSLDDDWYYFMSNGRMKTGWLSYKNSWYYFDKQNGYMWSDRWSKIDGCYYLFQKNGVMHKGWYKWIYSDGTYDWYYFDANGREARGWMKISGKWYYFNADEEDDDGWMYVDGIYMINGSNYMFDENGVMLTGWYYLTEYELWTYFDSNGKGHNGWLKSGRDWYWIEDGVMVSSDIVKTGDKWSQFDANGKWIGYVE